MKILGFYGKAKSNFVTAFALRATPNSASATRHAHRTLFPACATRQTRLPNSRSATRHTCCSTPPLRSDDVQPPTSCVRSYDPKMRPAIQEKYATRSRDFGQLAHDGPIHVSVSTRTWNMQLAECAQLCLNLGGVDILVNRVRTCIDHLCDRLCLCVGEWGCGTRRARATRQCPGRGERYAPVSGTLSATRQGVRDTSPCPRVDHTYMQATYETQDVARGRYRAIRSSAVPLARDTRG